MMAGIDETWSPILNGLGAEARLDRKNALDELGAKLAALSDSELADAFEKLHLALVARLGDETEVCRTKACALLSDLSARLPPSDYFLTYVVPAVKKRLVSSPPEESEELRLEYLKLIHSIVKRYDGEKIVPFLDDLVELLVKSAADEFPDAKRETCDTVATLAGSVPRDFHTRSETLCMSVVAVLAHRHLKVRVAAVRCIGAIVTHGNEKCFETAIFPIALKLFDECHSVRLQVIRELGDWMLNYKERYTYWHYMIPLILTGLSDAIPEVQDEAVKLWDSIGLKYLKENEDDVIDSDQPNHYPSQPRPNAGCRTLAVRNMAKILRVISKELDGFQDDPKLRSAQVLSSLILSAENKNVQFATTIYNCLAQGAKKDDPRIVNEIQKATEFFGYFVGPHIWWNLVISDVDEYHTLNILSHLIKSTPVEQLRVKYLKRIFKELNQTRFIHCQKPKYQMNLLNVCESTMNTCDVYCKSVSQDIFDIIFVIHSMPGNTDVEHHSLCLIEKLRETINFGSNIEELYCHYIKHILANITSIVCFWTPADADLRVLKTILIHTGPAIGLHLHLISPLLVEALSTKGPDPDVRLELFTTLCSVLLRRDEHFKLSDQEKLNIFLNIILREIIVPNLSWNVGQTAEALRTMAVCCLCALLQDNESVSDIEGEVQFDKCVKQIDLFPDNDTFQSNVDLLLPVLASLANDNSKNTRLYSLKAIHCLVKLAKKKSYFNVDHLHKTYAAVLSRLDDSNDKVRLFAVETLCTLFNSRPDSYDIKIYDAHIDALYNAMLTHLDDPDPTFQDFILDALKKLCSIHPKMLKGKVDSNTKLFKNTKALEHLDKHLESLTI